MDNKRLQTLESIYTQMNFAYYTGNENNMKMLFDEFGNQYHEFEYIRKTNINNVFIEHSLLPLASCPIEKVFGVELKYNIEGCLRTIWSILESNKYQTFSYHSIQVIYFPQKAFVSTDILYETPKGNNAKSDTLKVSDLLSVAKYSLQVLEIINPDERTSDVSDTITIIQGIDLALNNKPHDKPLNKSLHVVNSVLASVVKRNLENESDKRLVSSMGLLIDLAIDFFTGRK